MDIFRIKKRYGRNTVSEVMKNGEEGYETSGLYQAASEQ